MADQITKGEIALGLHEIGALSFGDFTFKSGIKSPMYIDLRIFISYPLFMKKVVKVYAKMLQDIKYDRLAGVAYGALPVTGALSLELEQPWVYMRKEGLAKAYGLKKSLEGKYKKGETVVMVEDIVTRATSLMEAITAIEAHGLKVKDAVVLLDYEKGGSKLLKEKGYNPHAFMTVREVVDIMHAKGKIDDKKYKQCIEFLSS
jgi:orotate phosphoribosyltransferase